MYRVRVGGQTRGGSFGFVAWDLHDSAWAFGLQAVQGFRWFRARVPGASSATRP